jgi:RNA polymerase sigma-70 factor (ECF subfamily)
MPAIRPIDRWFAEEVFPYEARFHAAARRFSQTPEEAEDLVQEAYARLFALDGWNAIGNPPGYVTQMLRHIAIERIRRQRIVRFQQLADVDHQAVVDEAALPDRVAAGKEAVDRLGERIARLPDRFREVFVRRRINGESSSDIARDLGISQSTFEKRLARAIEIVSRATLADKARDVDDVRSGLDRLKR